MLPGQTPSGPSPQSARSDDAVTRPCAFCPARRVVQLLLFTRVSRGLLARSVCYFLEKYFLYFFFLKNFLKNI